MRVAFKTVSSFETHILKTNSKNVCEWGGGWGGGGGKYLALLGLPVCIKSETKSGKKRLITSMEANYVVETGKSGGEANTAGRSGRCTVAY